ncbi:helix-turn-helix domain-containing protein [Kineococcus sp. G2]
MGRSKVYELMAGGQLPSVHIGKLRRIPSTCLAEYVERLRQDAA